MDWIFYKDIDWDDTNIKWYHIDTRDFDCFPSNEDTESKINYEILKPELYHFSKEELITLLDRFYSDSGGEGEWRFFTLDTPQEDFYDWSLKYLRIFKVGENFILCDKNEKPLEKEILKSPVHTGEFLNHIPKGG